MPDRRTRPILLAQDVPAADGRTYRVFADVDDVALRRVVPSLVARRVAPSMVALEGLTIRLEEQP